MPKRYLTVQNKENDSNQQQTSATTNTTARTSTKRASTNDPIPAKKAKTAVGQVDQENRPENANSPPPISIVNNPIFPLLYGLGLFNRNVYDAGDDDSDIDSDDSAMSSLTHDSDDDDDEFNETHEPPISTLADNIDDGEDYPRNKQYLVFRNPNPNKDDYIISKTARYWSLRYRKVLRHVNPDVYGMYIHADFSCYGELEVVENCLRDLTRTLFFVQQGVINVPQKPAEKVNYILGFRRLEALTILLEYANGIGGIDDGDRFYDIMRVISALYVTILGGLLPKVMFEKITTIDENLVKRLRSLARQIPNFKQVLEQALIIGHSFLTIGDVCSAYTQILQIVYSNWIFLLENRSIDLDQPSNEPLWKALKHAASIDPNTVEHGGKESFQFLRELRAYKNKHGLGGEAYDLSKWSRADREQFAFGRRSHAMRNIWFS